MMVKVFISYCRSDERLASRLYDDLRSRDLEVWFDKDSLIPGQDWKVEIQEAIQTCDFVVLLLSSTSLGRRGYFQKELKITLDVLLTIPFGHIYLLPVRLEACQIPAQLSALHCADLFPDWDHGLGRLLKAIEVQSGIQLNARSSEHEQLKGSAGILLVNDNPALMNFAVDIWKSHGLKVEYAFNVKQAIQVLEKAPQMIVVSDLSHFSYGQLVTNRAAFEILEWARSYERKIRVIISTSHLTQKRREDARRLDAIGICDNHVDLHHLIAQETGLSVNLPAELSGQTGLQKRSDPTNVAKRDSPRAFLFGASCDDSFAVKLLQDLVDRSCDVARERWRVSPWNVPKDTSFDDFDFDVAIVVVSELALLDSYFQAGVYNICQAHNIRGVLFVVLDEYAAKELYHLTVWARNAEQVDFRRNYDEALNQLSEGIRRLYEV
jgi:CheY-like chemotaxis protein